MSWESETSSAVETERLAATLSPLLSVGDVLVLMGDLGSGKTCFTRGVVAGLGLNSPGLVTSPTFVLMNCYEARVHVRHYDLYRLEHGAAIEGLGFLDVKEDCVSILEWGERVPVDLLGDHLRVSFEVIGTERRRISVHGPGLRSGRIELSWQQRVMGCHRE